MVDQQDAVSQTSTARPPVSTRTDKSQTEGTMGAAHRETIRSSVSSSSVSERRRASSVQRGRFLVQKAPESNTSVDSNKSHNNCPASAKPPEKKGRFLVQQASDCENPAAVAKDRANGNMESNTNMGNIAIPKPRSSEGRSISDHSADPTATNYSEDPTKQHVVDPQYDRRQSVQKGRFLVQSQQDESSTRILPMNHNNPAIPIGVIPGNQVVREKKGRFSVLEPNSVQPPEAGQHAAQNNSNISPAKHIAQQQPQTRTGASGIEGLANGQAPPTAAMHAAPNQQAGMTPMQGQPNQPLLKKKGRFVVSNMPVQAVFTNYQQEYHPQVSQPENIKVVFPLEEAATYVPTMPMEHGAPIDPNQHYYAASNMPPPPPPSMPPPPQQPGAGIETPLSSTSSIHKHYVPETPSCNPSPMTTTHKTEETTPGGFKHNNHAQPRRGADGGPNAKQRFGKMILFLDQMRSEVTEADRNVKTMQTNMKCMRERNKELEAQLREMEKKYQHEKVAREVAENKVKALKKKARAHSHNNSNGDAALMERKAEDSSAASCSSQQHADKLLRTNSLDGIQEVSENARNAEHSSFSKIEMASSNGSSIPAAPSTNESTVHPVVERTKSDVSPPRGHFNAGQTAVPSTSGNPGRSIPRSNSESSHHQPLAVRQQMQTHSIDDSSAQPIGVLHQQALAKSHPEHSGRQQQAASDFDPLRPSHIGQLDKALPAPVLVMKAQPTVGFMTEPERGSNLVQCGEGVPPIHPQHNGHLMQGMYVVPPAPSSHQHDGAMHQQQQQLHHHQQQHSFTGQPPSSNQSTFGSQCTQTSHPSVLNQDLLNGHQLHDPFDELVQTRSKTGK